jgi:aminopeptidase N
VRTLLALSYDYRQGKQLCLSAELPELYEYILRNDQHDKFLLAEMLHLPSEKYIGEQMEMVDVDAIHAAREFVLSEIANRLHNVFIETYHDLHDAQAPYQFNMEEVGKRQLKNLCLTYLMLLPSYVDMGVQQFEQALKLNMTDTLTAMSALSNVDSPLRDKILDKFYNAWQHDALVVDKWFAIQAATKLPIALQQVKKLMRHEAFDIKNPNKVYALIGTFGHRNPVNFHAPTGEGYAFLRETVEQLDKLNPQVAARMIKPLTTWKRYAKERQVLMQKQLELILLNKNISKDVYELVTKSTE